jgi:hypothetical protein
MHRSISQALSNIEEDITVLLYYGSNSTAVMSAATYVRVCSADLHNNPRTHMDGPARTRTSACVAVPGQRIVHDVWGRVRRVIWLATEDGEF